MLEKSNDKITVVHYPFSPKRSISIISRDERDSLSNSGSESDDVEMSPSKKLKREVSKKRILQFFEEEIESGEMPELEGFDSSLPSPASSPSFYKRQRETAPKLQKIIRENYRDENQNPFSKNKNFNFNFKPSNRRKSWVGGENDVSQTFQRSGSKKFARKNERRDNVEMISGERNRILNDRNSLNF